MKLYSNGEISQIFNSSFQAIESVIFSKPENYLFSANEYEFAEFLIQNHLIDFPVFYFDNIQVESLEQDIPAEFFPFSFDVQQGKSYKKSVIRYYIPYSGSIEILRFRGSTCSMTGGVDINTIQNKIYIDIIKFYDDANKIKQEFEQAKKQILSQYGYLKADVDEFNNKLLPFTLSTIQRRKSILEKDNAFLSALGVPIKKDENVSDTFSIPKPKLRKKIIIEPSVPKDNFKPEPTLSLENYNEILKIIYDVGKNFENLPSTYTEKEEEDLRDHILFTLDPNFQYGSASGETFNKTGRSDIMLNYQGNVVFIAECKFWHGEKKHIETIDQLLGYLTWRNTKAAIVLFVRNKDISKVLTKVSETTESHPNYIRRSSSKNESWYTDIIHLNDDQDREIYITTLIFHLPPIE